MKKLLLVLLVVALASFLLTGCFGVPDGTEGEDEIVVPASVTVEIEDEYKDGGTTWVPCGNNEIIVTFAAPVTGSVSAQITDCSGDYTKGKAPIDVVLFPDADKKVWTGSGYFGLPMDYGDCIGCYLEPCCATTVKIISGACEAEACINYPVIVDCEDPYAHIELCMGDCDCAGCTLSFTSTESGCDDDMDCGDDCSGLASWQIDMYDHNPFDECCDIPCAAALDSSGLQTACPISWTTTCLTDFAPVITGYETVCGEVVCVDYYVETDSCEEWTYCGGEPCDPLVCCEYAWETQEVCTVDCVDNEITECTMLFAVVTLVDNVGNKAKYGTWVGTCDYDDCSTIDFDPVCDHDCLDDADGVFTYCSGCDGNYTCDCQDLDTCY